MSDRVQGGAVGPLPIASVAAAIVLGVVWASKPDPDFAAALAAAPVSLPAGAVSAIQIALAPGAAFFAVLLAFRLGRPLSARRRRLSTLARSGLNALLGVPVGFALAMTHDAFARAPELFGEGIAAAAQRFGLFEAAALTFAGLLALFGAVTAGISVAGLDARLTGRGLSKAERRQSLPAGGAMAAEGGALVLLTFAVHMAWTTITPAHWWVGGGLALLIGLDLFFLWRCWRTADELFRTTWFEGMAATLAVLLPMGVGWSALEGAGIAPRADLFHAVVVSYMAYVLIGTGVTAARMPDAFGPDALEERA